VKVVDTTTNAKLKVTFFWPFYGDYWIIGLDPEYRRAVVGEPSRKYLWILSRTPKLSSADSAQRTRSSNRAATTAPPSLRQNRTRAMRLLAKAGFALYNKRNEPRRLRNLMLYLHKNSGKFTHFLTQ
jgi:hypothetical protein